MSSLVMPVLLLLVVCVPAALAAAVAAALSPVGRAVGAPPRGDATLAGYARLLLGIPPRRVHEREWEKFEALLSEVAVGRVGPWDRLGPDVTPLPPYPPSDSSRPQGRVQQRINSIQWPRGVAIRRTVRLPLIVVGSLVALSMLMSLRAPQFSYADTAAAAGTLRTGTQWVQGSNGSARTTVPWNDGPRIAARLPAAGFEGNCRALATASTAGITSNPAAASGSLGRAVTSTNSPYAVLCSAVTGKHRLEAFATPSGISLQVTPY